MKIYVMYNVDGVMGLTIDLEEAQKWAEENSYSSAQYEECYLAIPELERLRAENANMKEAVDIDLGEKMPLLVRIKELEAEANAWRIKCKDKGFSERETKERADKLEARVKLREDEIQRLQEALAEIRLHGSQYSGDGLTCAKIANEVLQGVAT